ncbi:hypothetical protein Slala03_76700 [Streptomyces lavendulae subsp. lavendulae]|uniref:hypothetical protein n=1 Tax=Streptomyces lavendulae TaxID=1914 RepID=UPI00249FAC39|nr:hypothetical protein [Streptomyces lavendulae]GLV87981.1 hypothetical protein Slala03_76700 [Streptomyces lavendulae subsp. lavendulae]
MATLGPAGTDAQAEAAQHFENIVLADSFEGAMRVGLNDGAYVLVAAGFLERDGKDVVDSWVDMHFRNHGRMRLTATWESSTKVMCVATNPASAKTPEEMKTLAIHPATAAFANRFAPLAQHAYVNAKPIAVQWAAEGRADGCIGSLDVVQQRDTLKVHQIFRPTMVWCLYERVLGT